MEFLSIQHIFRESIVAEQAGVRGWVRSVRKSKKFCFVVLNDGSCQDNLQIVVDADLPNYEEISSMTSGASASFVGKLVQSGGKNQSIEMQATETSLIGESGEDYPIQKKATSLEFLRSKAHFRPRTNLFGAIFRVRHALTMATHEFFHNRGFYNLHSPIITAVDAEGAGEQFRVSTLNFDEFPRTEKGEIDFSKDYFGKESSLCVTGQLEGECFALGLGKVYTFGPTFRSENSNTARHLAEFWMIEPEMAFCDLEQNAQLAADYIKYMISYALKNCQKELDFIWKRPDVEDGQAERLQSVLDNDFKKITYTQAVEILEKSGQKFEFPVSWGVELQTEHEKYLTDIHFKGPVTVTDYPSSCKAFYMKQNPDGKTVRAMDVLVPGVGELIGGSQREESLEKLEAKMDSMGMNKEPLWWYLELRKFGSVPHSGFGLGFERAIMYITGVKNIRDVIPFPRTPGSCDF